MRDRTSLQGSAGDHTGRQRHGPVEGPILFAGTGDYLPEMTGGVESTTHELCTALAAAGSSVAVLARTPRMSRFALRARVGQLLGRPALSCDSSPGYPVYRSRHPLELVDAVCEIVRPVLALVQIGRIVPLARAFAARLIPTILFVHNLDFAEMGGDLAAHPLVRHVTVSHFMASVLEQRLGARPDVLTPLIEPERYRTETSREVVTFINPRRIKGLAIALHLARRRPDVSFEFVEAWPLGRRDRLALTAQLAGLSNVRLLWRTEDMRGVYRRTRLLLVPSQVQESWGRVVSEAQLNGIPVLASSTGALAEAVGGGGVLVAPHDEAEAWQIAFDALWDDQSRYQALAQAALAHARRPGMQYQHGVDRFIALAREQMGKPAQP